MSDQICKFFLKNSCRYGDRCRYLHSYPDEHDYESKRSYNNRYKYLQDDFDKEKQRAPEKAASLSVGDTIIALAKEIKQNYDANMWSLTVLGFGSHNVPGWDDFSPEEIRWQFLSNSNFPNEYESLKMKTHQNRQLFLNPNSQTYELIKNMLSSDQPSYPADQFKQSNINQQSVFGNVPNQQSIFGSVPNQQSVFGNTPLFGQAQNQNVFGNQKSVFGTSFAAPLPEETISDEEMSQGNQSLGQTNIFGQVPLQSNFGSSTPLKAGPAPSVFDVSTSQSFFGNAPSQQSVFGVNQQSVFGNKPNQQSIFGSVPSQQSVFGNVPKQESIFGNAPSQFGQSIFGSVPKQNFGNAKTSESQNVYSKMSDLTEEEIEQFKAPTFERFKLPVKPPPRELCTA